MSLKIFYLCIIHAVLSSISIVLANQDAERAQMSTFAVAKQYAKDIGNSAPDLYASQFHNPTLDDYFALKEWETSQNPDIKAALLKNPIIAQHVSLLQSFTKQNYKAAQEAARKERMNPYWFRYLKYFEDNLAAMSSLSFSEANQTATKEDLHIHWVVLSHNATKDSQELLRKWISTKDSAYNSILDRSEIGHLYSANPTMDIGKAQELLCSSQGIHRRSSGANICRPAFPTTTSATTAITTSATRTSTSITSSTISFRNDLGLYVNEDSEQILLDMVQDNISYECGVKSFPAAQHRAISDTAGPNLKGYPISYRSRGEYKAVKLKSATVNLATTKLLRNCDVLTGTTFEHFAINATNSRNNIWRVFFQSRTQPPPASELSSYKLLNFTQFIFKKKLKSQKKQIYFKFCGLAYHPPQGTNGKNMYSSCTINPTSSMLSTNSMLSTSFKLSASSSI